MLHPGYGYWVWSYHDDVEFLLSVNMSDDDYITMLGEKWNLVGYPYISSIAKEDLIIYFDGVNYSWFEATSFPDPIILGYVYGWNGGSWLFVYNLFVESCSVNSVPFPSVDSNFISPP